MLVENDLDGNNSNTRADGRGLGGPKFRWQTYECGSSDFYQVFNFLWPWGTNFLVEEWFYSGTSNSNYCHRTVGRLGFVCWHLCVAVMLHGIICIRCVPSDGWQFPSRIFGAGTGCQWPCTSVTTEIVRICQEQPGGDNVLGKNDMGKSKDWYGG